MKLNVVIINGIGRVHAKSFKKNERTSNKTDTEHVLTYIDSTSSREALGNHLAVLAGENTSGQESIDFKELLCIYDASEGLLISIYSQGIKDIPHEKDSFGVTNVHAVERNPSVILAITSTEE